MYKFISLSRSEQLILLRSSILITAIVLSLRIFSLFTVRRLLAKIYQPANDFQESDQFEIEKIVTAVKIVSRYIPKAKCLPQALAAQVLLERQGYSTQLYIGVAKHSGEQILAHAWVKSKGQIVIGGSESSSHYIPIPLSLVK